MASGWTLRTSRLPPPHENRWPFRFWTQSKIQTTLRLVSTNPAELLRSHGVQVTAQRLSVLGAVAKHPHATADDVAREVRSDIGAISRQSVYDSLTVLVEKGILRRIQPVGSAARYEDRVGDNHHHLICRQCGQLTDIDCATGAAPCLTPAQDLGYQIDEAEVAYWGICPQCQVAVPPRDSKPATNRQQPKHRNTRTQQEDSRV